MTLPRLTFCDKAMLRNVRIFGHGIDIEGDKISTGIDGASFYNVWVECSPHGEEVPEFDRTYYDHELAAAWLYAWQIAAKYHLPVEEY